MQRTEKSIIFINKIINLGLKFLYLHDIKVSLLNCQRKNEAYFADIVCAVYGF